MRMWVLTIAVAALWGAAGCNKRVATAPAAVTPEQQREMDAHRAAVDAEERKRVTAAPAARGEHRVEDEERRRRN